MGEVPVSGVFSVCHCQPLFCLRKGLRFGPENLKGKLIRKQDRICRAKAELSSEKPKKKEPLTFFFRYTIDAPLSESPQASFDQYLEDEQRVFKAIFPDKKITQIKEEEWRINMPAMQVLFLSVFLVLYVKLRCKSAREDYPPHVPQATSKLLELDISRWELLGPSEEYQAGDFSLCIKGAIFSERKGTQSWLRNIYDINLSFVVLPVLAWVPDNVMRGITESLVRTAMDDVKLNASLIADYDQFKQEKLKSAV